jgi:predicted pyridoxine 5'-phosphate oxidase superfamily flavin-nucleotide-binding protein
MTHDFLDLATTPAVRAAQEANGSLELWDESRRGRPANRFTSAETAFIAQRDSFYMATVTEDGWPYVQHRGGPAGFLKVLDERTLAFADFSGNRQYLSLGNLTADGRAALILIDYRRRRRLKILVHVAVREVDEGDALAAALGSPDYKARVERAMLMTLEAFDWNCPQHITPRFTASEVEHATERLQDRIADLERENAALREGLAATAPS